MIIFSDDVDQAPDSSGEYTGASLTKPDMPKDFTICAAYMVEAWTTAFASAVLFQLNDRGGDQWAYVMMYAARYYTEFNVYIGRVTVEAYIDRLLFLLMWTRVCVSLDTVTGSVRIVVNGEVLEDKVHQEALEEDTWRPDNLDMVLGYYSATSWANNTQEWYPSLTCSLPPCPPPGWSP